MTEPALQPRGVRGVASKLHDDHLQRLAIVYVRQSHPQQVVEHVESTARQDALVDRAVALGWCETALSSLMKIKAKAARVW